VAGRRASVLTRRGHCSPQPFTPMSNGIWPEGPEPEFDRDR
jgi:hypothetical protein